MIIYHITKEKYIPFILVNGFVKKSHIKYYHKKYNIQPIFLTIDILHIINTQLTTKFMKDCYVITLNLDVNNLEPEYEYLNNLIDIDTNIYNKTYICRKNIDVSNILKIEHINNIIQP